MTTAGGEAAADTSTREPVRQKEDPKVRPWARHPRLGEGLVAESLPVRLTPAKPTLTAHAGRELPEANIAIVGASGVGKSTFIQRALGLRRLPSAPLSSRKMSINCVPHQVRLLELDIDGLELDDDGRIRWPTRFGDQEVPHVQGTLVLCDVTSQRSLTAIPRIVGRCS